VARLALRVVQELRVATKAKVLELRGDSVKVKINMATISNKATVEEETSGEAEGVEEAGNTLESKTVAFITGFGKQKSRSLGVWTRKWPYGTNAAFIDLLVYVWPLAHALHILLRPAAHVQRFWMWTKVTLYA
jgi:hypothetical protein